MPAYRRRLWPARRSDRSRLDALRWQASNGIDRWRQNMPVTVKKIVLWRTEVENKPGTLASTMGPPAKAGADVKGGMGYRHPTAGGKAAIEIFPITGQKPTAAAVATA